MRIGVGVGPLWGVEGTHIRVVDVVDQVRQAHARGFSSVWMPNVSLDAVTVLAHAGSQVSDIELATGVVPIHPRHPAMLAAQARTAAEMTNGRLTLGIGLSHKMLVEGMWGLSYEKPARYMREYLTILGALLRDAPVSFSGEVFNVNAPAGFGGSTAQHDVPVIVAALAPQMLSAAGAFADGTVTWMTSPKVLNSRIVPTIGEAAAQAGRPAPRVVSPSPICVSSDIDRASDDATRIYGMYGAVPSYRSMLDENAAGTQAVDVCVIGDEDTVLGRIEEFEAAGATDFVGVVFGTPEERERTYDLLGARARLA